MYNVAMNLRRIHPIRSGVEAYMDGLVRALVKRGDVTLLGVVPSADVPLPDGVTRCIEPLEASAGLPAKVWYDFVRSGRAATRAGALMYHGVDTFLPAGLSQAMTCIVNVHDLGYFRHPHLFDRRTRLLNQWHARVRLRRADHFIALSTLTADDLMVRLGVKAKLITVIPAAHDEFFVEDPHDLLAVRPFMMTVGGSNPRKNLGRVLPAFATWREQSAARASMQLRLTGHVSDEVSSRAYDLLGDAVVIEGFVTRERLRTLYRNAQALVFPALYEGFGLPILEAMACGAPVLTTGSGATRDVSGDAAVGVDPLDVASIASGIALVHQRRVELRERGRLRAAQFSWEQTAAMTTGIYGQNVR